jgi:hypothetical protein
MTRRPHADTLEQVGSIVSTQLIFGMLGMLGMFEGGVIGKYAYGGARLSLILPARLLTMHNEIQGLDPS